MKNHQAQLLACCQAMELGEMFGKLTLRVFLSPPSQESSQKG